MESAAVAASILGRRQENQCAKRYRAPAAGRGNAGTRSRNSAAARSGSAAARDARDVNQRLYAPATLGWSRVDQQRLAVVGDRRLRRRPPCATFVMRRQVVHRVEQRPARGSSAGRARRSCAPAPCARSRAAPSSRISSSTPSIANSLLVLLDQRVLRLDEDLDQRGLVELVERRDDRQAADELGNQAELDQVFGLDSRSRLVDAARDRPATATSAPKPMPRLRRAVADDLLEAVERAAADEQDVGRVDLQELLVRMLAAALRRHRGDRAFDQLQQRLLHAFARHVARDRRVVASCARSCRSRRCRRCRAAPSRRRSRTSAAASG